MIKQEINILYDDAIGLLQQLIGIPSLSKEESKTADCIDFFLKERNVLAFRLLNNIWCTNKYFDAAKPSILLNSHHDTVAANSAYTNDPFNAKLEGGKLFGLGSTDAGASLVSLIAAFLYFYEEENLAYNIVFAATAEEEISGTNGIEKLFANEDFNKYFIHSNSFAIVGEPTQLQLAVAEKGLLVLDCVAHGEAGHAARDEGENAIYKAMKAIEWLKNYHFEKVSPLLGEVKMTVTSISTQNKAHNIIPAECSFVVDIRITELYSHEEIISTIKENVVAAVTPRSTRLRSSSIDINHPVVQAGISLGKETYGSPTLSDKALMPLPSLKCGPGNSNQSHSADEYVQVKDIEEAIRFYVELLETIFKRNG
ncbi:MAG: M20/M25/M40 family metallo-hydrolase [Ferruginibacter sp.]